jgi:hypothetical protein
LKKDEDEKASFVSEEIYEDTYQNMMHFIKSWSDFLKASPDENQHVFVEVLRQVSKVPLKRIDYLEGKHGQEPVFVYEYKGVTINKRIFHPGQGEKIRGVDFILFKYIEPYLGRIGMVAIQTKRNRGNAYYEFLQRDYDQLERLSNFWKSAYYLFVDETIKPPLLCFLLLSELRTLLNSPPTKISNEEVRRFCRGPEVFYNAFYSCRRGSKDTIKNYLLNVTEYSSVTKRTLLELATNPLKQNNRQLKIPDFSNKD